MPKARRLAVHSRASTDEDLLPRLSQQERLFSNLDGSMKHEAGSLFGSITLIAGARRKMSCASAPMGGHACTMHVHVAGHVYVTNCEDNPLRLL